MKNMIINCQNTQFSNNVKKILLVIRTSRPEVRFPVAVLERGRERKGYLVFHFSKVPSWAVDLRLQRRWAWAWLSKLRPIPHTSGQPSRSRKCRWGNASPFELQMYFYAIKDVISWYRFRLLFKSVSLLKNGSLGKEDLHSHFLLRAKIFSCMGLHACVNAYKKTHPHCLHWWKEMKGRLDKLTGVVGLAVAPWDHQGSAGGSVQASWLSHRTPSFLMTWLNVFWLGVPWQTGIIKTPLR